MIKLDDKPNTTAPTAQNPYGQIVDDDGTGNGTPVTKEVYQDHHIFFEKLMSEAGITPNGILDNAYDGFQLYQALFSILGSVKKKLVSIGDWNMNVSSSGSSTTTVLHGLSDYKKIRNVSAIIRTDTDTTRYILGSGNVSGVVNGGVGAIGTTTITLISATSGTFDNTSFDSTSFNRGYVIIEYE